MLSQNLPQTQKNSTLIYTHPHLFYTYNRTHPQIFLKFSKLLSKISPLTANFPKSFPKFHKNTKAPPPACIFSDLRHFFCFILGVGLKKFANFFRKRYFLCYNFACF